VTTTATFLISAVVFVAGFAAGYWYCSAVRDSYED